MSLKHIYSVLCASLIAVSASCTRPHSASAQVDTIDVYSKAMGRSIKVQVTKPDKYESRNMAYSVVYLLHGHGDNFGAWSRNRDLWKDADDHLFIFVCVDGGTSWYFDSPLDQKCKYETFIVDELVPYIDGHYQTVADPSHRAIVGLSMGGQGAVRLAMHHPDVWKVAGAMSGIVDICDFPNRFDLEKVLGDYYTHKSLWHENAIINQIDRLKRADLKLALDCGDEDFAYPCNLAFHNALLREDIEHVYICRKGAHDWNYWRESLDYMYTFVKKSFQQLQQK